MNRLTETTALTAYARMINTLDINCLEPLLANDFVYESQSVLQALESKQSFLDYMVPKLQTIRHSSKPAWAEMGNVAVCGTNRPCVVLAQSDRNNLVGLVVAETGGGTIKRLDYCIVPAPDSAQRSGRYPA